MQIQNIILVAAESVETREAIRTILENKYDILEAGNQEQTLFLLSQNYKSIAAVILEDSILVEEGLAKNIQQAPHLANVPLLVIIDGGNVWREYEVFSLGAYETITRPFYPELIHMRLSRIIALYMRERNLAQVVEEQQNTLYQNNNVMVDTMISIIESRSVESGQHILRIRKYTQILLETVAEHCPEYGLTEENIRMITGASALHDIGKILIPDNILNKPGRLTPEEFTVMKTHSAGGGYILKKLGSLGSEDYMRYAYNICRWHHERWDGRGYPDGLTGEEIPICAQVVGLADVYDALTTNRVYKKACSSNEAAAMILRGDCGAFSPALFECFKLVSADFARLAKQYADGHSPEADAITVPLTAPDSVRDNKLLYTVSKYEKLLYYTGDTIAEIDLDQDLYYLVFNPNPDLAFLRNVSTMKGAMEELADKAVHPDDRTMLLQFPEYVETLFREGLQKLVRSYRLKTTGGYRSYTVTTLRIDTDNVRRRVLAIWHPEMGEVTPAIPGTKEDALLPEMGTGEFLPFCCRYDRDLTFVGDPSPMLSRLGLENVRGLLDCVIPSQRETVADHLRKCLTHGTHFAVECRLLSEKMGGRRVILSGSQTTEDGREYLRGVLHDVSTIADGKNEDFLRMQEFLHAMVRPGEDLFLEWDGDKNALRCLSGNTERLGLRGMGDEYLRLMQMHPDDASLFRQEIERLEQMEGECELSLRIAGRMGRYTLNRLRLASRREGKRIRILGIMINIESGAQIGGESRGQDTLTGLPDKNFVRRQIENQLDLTGDNVLSALLIVDLDNFKSVNATYGHLFGDAMLTRVAEAISRQLRWNDPLTRIGGDEFLVYLHDVPDRDAAMTISHAIQRAVGDAFRRELPGNPVTCSVGIACTPDHGKTYDHLLQCADQALYEAKTRGKNCVALYDPAEAASAPTMVGEHIDSSRESSQVGIGLAQYVFSRLYESGDVDVTIRTILEIVGRQMDVSRVYIFENNYNNTLCSNTYEWCADGVSPEMDHLQNVSYETDIPGYRENFDSRGMFFVHDVDDLPQHLKDILKPQGICSMLQCAILDGGKFRGYVGFDDNNSTRVWEKEQIEILSFLARILSVFILKQRNRDTAADLLQDMDRIMDACFDWVYVVDPDTYTLQFINRRIRETIPAAKPGSLCYKVFMNRERPCENCPLFCGEEGYSALLEKSVVGVDVIATGNSIHWNGKTAWLITCHEQKTRAVSHIAPEPSEGEEVKPAEDSRELLLQAYRAVLEATPAMTFVKDRNLRYRGATTSFARMMGVEREADLIGKTDREILENQELAQKYMSDDRQVMASGEQMIRFVEPLPEENGQPRYASTSKFVIRDASGEVAGLAGSSRDVTREMLASRNHQRELEYLFSLPEDTYISLYMDVTSWSVIAEQQQEIRGIRMPRHESMDTLASRAFLNVVDRRGSAYSFWRDFSKETILAIYHSGKRDIVMEYLRRVSPEEVRWVRSEFRFLTDPRNGHLCLILLVRDIHKKKEEERKILWAAKRDGLTGLLNHSAMKEQLRDFLTGDNATHNHAIFAIDLDGFKKVNDTYGHKRGDEFLIQIANAIRSTFRDTDLVGRMGGDEFLVLMKFTPTEDVVREKAQDLLEAMRDVCGELSQLGVSGSVGISIFGSRRDGTDLEALLEKADRALYRAKASGKNCAVMVSDIIGL